MGLLRGIAPSLHRRCKELFAIVLTELGLQTSAAESDSFSEDAGLDDLVASILLMDPPERLRSLQGMDPTLRTVVVPKVIGELRSRYPEGIDGWIYNCGFHLPVVYPQQPTHGKPPAIIINDHVDDDDDDDLEVICIN